MAIEPGENSLNVGIIEKIRIGLKHKDEGNEAFKNDDIPKALASYHRAIAFFTGMANGALVARAFEEAAKKGEKAETGTVMDETSLKHQTCLVHANIALCMLKQNKFERALAHSDKALSFNNLYLKAMVRRVEALKGLEKFGAAESYIKETIASKGSSLNKVDLATLAAKKREIAKLKSGNSSAPASNAAKLAGTVSAAPLPAKVTTASA